MKNTPLKIFIIILGFFIFLAPAQAADFLFDSEYLELNKGDETKINFFIDAKNGPINAIEGELEIPKNIQVKQIIESGSGIDFWIEKPVIKNNILNFSGITVNGFNSKITAFSLVIEAQNDGTEKIKLSDARALLNDGLGTADEVNYFPLEIKVSPADKEPLLIIPDKDFEPPQFLFYEITKDKNLFDDKYTLIFFAEDKISGVSHYKVLEQKQYEFFGIKFCREKWQKAESPHLLNDQKLKSFIQITAFDNEGNERSVFLPATFQIKWYENIIFWSIILITLFLGVIFSIYVKRRVKK